MFFRHDRHESLWSVIERLKIGKKWRPENQHKIDFERRQRSHGVFMVDDFYHKFDQRMRLAELG